METLADLKVLKITPEEKISTYKATLTTSGKLKVLLSLVEGFNDKEITLEFLPDRSKETGEFSLLEMSQTLVAQIEQKIDEVTVKTIQSRASTVSALNVYSSAGADAVTLGLSLLSLDFGGHLMKLSQMNKLFCRFRFLDINFGGYLGSYFDWSAKKFDPPTEKSREITVT